MCAEELTHANARVQRWQEEEEVFSGEEQNIYIWNVASTDIANTLHTAVEYGYFY